MASLPSSPRRALSRTCQRLLVLVAALAACATATEGLARGPNVLFVVIDDLRPIATLPEQPALMPNLDALAARGFRFLNNYANVPVCGASRASMLSGLAPTVRRFISFDSRLDGDVPEAESLPAFFRRHGWHTAANGKVFDLIADSAQGWSDPVWNPEMRWHSPVPEDGRGEHLQKAYLARPEGGRPPVSERGEVDDSGYPDGEIAFKSVADIGRLAKLGKPFFLAVGFRKPHLPFNAPARYWVDAGSDAELLPASWYQPAEGLPPEALHRSLELRMQYDALPLLGDIDEAGARAIVRDYHAAVRYADAQLGRLIDALDASGVADETLIVVAGDHGWLLGEQRMWTKHALFETALRTPLIIVAPGRDGGRVVEAVTDLLDLYPTLADLAGLEVPDDLDGVSLLPLLDNPALASHPDKPVSISRWLDGESVRDDRYRYTAWFDAQGREIARMMFDLHSDPHELQNIAEHEDKAEVVDRLHGVLIAHRAGAQWSPQLAAIVSRMAFARSTFGPLVMAVMVRPVVVLIGALGIVLAVVSGWLYYRRKIRQV